MADIQSSAGNELQYIYSIFRKLRLFGEGDKESNLTGLDARCVPRVFVFKLIDERLKNLDKLSADLATNLFKRLTRKSKNGSDENRHLSSILWPELDEYFHYSLYHLHDFILEFNWYESDFDELTQSNAEFVRSNLTHMNAFLTFKSLLTKFSPESLPTPVAVSVKSPELERVPSSKSIKSALSQGRIESPGRRRRVRFLGSNRSQSEISPTPPTVGSSSLKIGHSILALDLLIYALNLFIQQVCNQLAAWASETSDLKDSLKIIRESRKKLGTKQLLAISNQIKTSNDVYFSVLDCLAVLRNIYLTDYVINTLCSRDPERLLNLYKAPRVRTFVRRIQLDVERKVISKLADQILQILFDLIVAEINLPPLELGVETKDKKKNELERSRDNYLSFITSWFRADQVLFGSKNKGQPSRQSLSSVASKEDKTSIKATSTLATGGRFKSSSRILAQMDNLDELMRDLLNEIVGRIRSTVQLKFFAELLHVGLQHLFDSMSVVLLAQLDGARKSQSDGSKQSESTINETETVLDSVNLVVARIRCFKFAHIISSLDKMIAGLASVCGANLDNELSDTKLVQFTNRCTQLSRPSAGI